MLSVLGTSFGFLPIYENAIQAMKADGTAEKKRLRENVGDDNGVRFSRNYFVLSLKDKCEGCSQTLSLV